MRTSHSQVAALLLVSPVPFGSRAIEHKNVRAQFCSGGNFRTCSASLAILVRVCHRSRQLFSSRGQAKCLCRRSELCFACGHTAQFRKEDKMDVAKCSQFFMMMFLATSLVQYTAEAHTAANTAAEHKLLEAGQAVNFTNTRPEGERWATARILIEAPPMVVWNTVHAERDHDPDIMYSRVLEQGVNECVLEQKFSVMPVVGSAVCVMRQVEKPLKRIDYCLIRSDRFKSLKGSWILTPTADGNMTYLELSTFADTGLRLPRVLVDSFTAQKLERRLTNIKHMAEAEQLRVAAQVVVLSH